MDVESYFQLAEHLPEPMLLVTASGLVQAANRHAAEVFDTELGALRGRSLFDLADNPRSQLLEFLRACARSGDFVYGNLSSRGHTAREERFRVEGCAVVPRQGEQPALILLRLQPHPSAAGRFLLLNQKIEELSREIAARQQVEEELRRQREWLEVTLASIGDAVIATDLHGRVIFENPVAAALTGWPAEEASGRPLEEVFRIINEETLETVNSPVSIVLRENRVVGLANHTVLLNREGRAIPIDDSGAPIRNQRGELLGVVLVFRDVTEHKRAEAARRESETRFQVMANSAPVMIWMADTTSRCIWFNEPWLNFTGRKMEQELGHGWTEGVHPDDVGRCIAEYETGFAARKPFQLEYRLRRGDGEYRWVLDVGVPLYSEQEFIGYIGSCIDFTERKHAEEERERLLAAERLARSEAERASRMKDEFLSTVSHELRTPLNAILGWTQLLRTGQLGDQEMLEGLEVIERNSRAQAQIIDDLLDMSRIITGKLRLDVQPVVLDEVVEAAIETLRPAAAAKEIRLEMQLDGSPGLIRGDFNRLQQVLWNLLSNAIKFTAPFGQVTVAVRAAESQVALEVADTGQGINPEFLPHVFERFRQADAGSGRKHGGLGLGLAIVKNLVELHGGSVEAHSDGPGSGTRFVVLLPLASSQDRDQRGAED